MAKNTAHEKSGHIVGVEDDRGWAATMNADYCTSLFGAGYRAIYTASDDGRSPYFFGHVGPFATEEEAEAVRRSLIASGDWRDDSGKQLEPPVYEVSKRNA